MRRPGNSRLFFFLGLLAIAILYTAYNLYVLDPYVYESMTRHTRHFYKFGSVLLAYAIGLFAYRKFCPPWLLHLWHLLYAAGLCLLLLLAVYDGLISELSPPLRKVISTFHEFLISPIPYVFIGIINRALRPPPPTA